MLSRFTWNCLCCFSLKFWCFCTVVYIANDHRCVAYGHPESEYRVTDLAQGMLATLLRIETLSGSATYVAPLDQMNAELQELPWKLIDRLPSGEAGRWAVMEEGSFIVDTVRWRLRQETVTYGRGISGKIETNAEIFAFDGSDRYSLDLSDRYGMIIPILPGTNLNWPRPNFPLCGYGYGITSDEFRPIHLAELIESGTVSPTTSAFEFEVLPSHEYLQAQRYVVGMNKSNLFVPERIDSFARMNEDHPWTITARWECRDSVAIGGVPIPTEIVFLSPKSNKSNTDNSDLGLQIVGALIVDPLSLRLNESVSEDKFRISFDPTKDKWADERTRTSHGGHPPFPEEVGLMLPLDNESHIAMNDSTNWFRVSLLGLSALLLAVLIKLAVRRLSSLMLLVGTSCAFTGCEHINTEPQEQALVQVQGSRVREVTMPAGSTLNHTELFYVKNLSNDEIELDDARVSCGCISVRVDKGIIVPNGTALVQVSVAKPHFIARQEYSVMIPLKGISFNKAQLDLRLVLTPESDWAPSVSYLRVHGSAGRKASFKLRIHKRDDQDPLFSISENNIFALVDSTAISRRIVELTFNALVPLETETHHSLRLMASGAVPSEWIVDIDLVPSPLAKWNPRSLLIDRENVIYPVQLEFEPGCILEQVICPPGLSIHSQDLTGRTASIELAVGTNCDFLTDNAFAVIRYEGNLLKFPLPIANRL